VRRGIDTTALLRRASMPAAGAGPNPSADEALRLADEFPGVTAGAIDWVRFGQQLRHDLGWDDTYPAEPDFPELRG